MTLLYEGYEWTPAILDKTWAAIDYIGTVEMGLNYPTPQLEIVTAEQMLDAYSSVGMPVMYNHWSFGKSFITNEKEYLNGNQNLAYEMVINTDPCIAYLMENNTMTMQATVLAHACCGHGSFFKNNYLFKEWTDPSAIVDYLIYAREYVARCEVRYGAGVVERLLDACHALEYYGVDKYRRPSSLKKEVKEKREQEWREYAQATFDDLWRTVPGQKLKKESLKLKHTIQNIKKDPRSTPEENILYFIEKHSPILKPWQKEIVRIVRKIAQYFYPQYQTKLMNEGWASFIHYEIMNKLFNQGLIGEGAMLEFLASHAGLIGQQSYTSPHYSGFNPYALGFAMMNDIKRICTEPTTEDRLWFPDIVDTDYLETLPEIISNYKDESFVLQFLSPKIIRDFKLFTLHDSEGVSNYTVVQIHSDDYVKQIRQTLSKMYNFTYRLPQIEVLKVDWGKTRELTLAHKVLDGKVLDTEEAQKVIKYLDQLWGFNVNLIDVDQDYRPI